MAAPKEDENKTIVILHQLSRGKFTPCISPFALKLETYLRMAGIPYKNDFKNPMGPKGKTPWITVNGKKVGDSQICLELLAELFHKDFSSHLTAEEKSIARAFQIMMEDHLHWALMVWRWRDDHGRSLSTIQSDLHVAIRYLRPLVANRVISQTSAQGMGRHKSAEVTAMAIKDLRAISDYLGTKPFLMGDQPVEVDCAIFGLLAQIVWNSRGSPYEPLVNGGEMINLRNYCLRMKERFWPDWNQCLTPSIDN